MLTRLALVTATAGALVTAWPLATTVLAQTAVLSDDGSSAQPASTMPAPPLDELPILDVPPPLPPIETSLSAAAEPPSPAPLASASATEPQAVASPPPPATPVSAAPAAPLTGSRPARPRVVTRSAKTPAAGPALTVLNGRESPVVSVTVTAGDTMVRQNRPVAPNARAIVALPKGIGCTVTVEAVFQDEGVSEVRSIDACKVRLVRLTD